MSAREYLNKYPEVEQVVEAAVKTARHQQLSVDAAVKLLAKALARKWGKKMASFAEEFFIA